MGMIFREKEGAPAGTGAPGGETPPTPPPASATPPAVEAPASPSARGAAPTEDDVDLTDLPAATPDAVRELIRKERRDRQTAERQAREARAALSEKERAEMTETQRLQTDNERLQGDVQRLTDEARGRAIREAVGELAPGLGIGDPKLAARLLDSKDLEFGDDGMPNRKKLEAKLTALKSEYPSIASRSRGSADAGAGASSEPSQSDISARIRARLRGEA